MDERELTELVVGQAREIVDARIAGELTGHSVTAGWIAWPAADSLMKSCEDDVLVALVGPG